MGSFKDLYVVKGEDYSPYNIILTLCNLKLRVDELNTIFKNNEYLTDDEYQDITKDLADIIKYLRYHFISTKEEDVYIPDSKMKSAIYEFFNTHVRDMYETMDIMFSVRGYTYMTDNFGIISDNINRIINMYIMKCYPNAHSDLDFYSIVSSDNVELILERLRYKRSSILYMADELGLAYTICHKLKYIIEKHVIFDDAVAKSIYERKIKDILNSSRSDYRLFLRFLRELGYNSYKIVIGCKDANLTLGILNKLLGEMDNAMADVKYGEWKNGCLKVRV